MPNHPIASRYRSRVPAHRAARRWTVALLGTAALITGVGAKADTWFFVDSKGVLHYANERLDERYQRFSMGPVAPEDGPLYVDITAAAQQLAEASEQDRGVAQRYFSRSKGYQMHAKHLQAAAKKHGVDVELLKAVATAESGFNAQAVSPKGAVGLMQVIPATAERFGVTGDHKRSLEQKLMDPAISAPLGARYLRYLQTLFPGRTDLVLAAYNAGEGAVKRYGNKIPPYKETQNYVKTVMSLYKSLQPAPQIVASAEPVGWKGDSTSTVIGPSPTGNGRLRTTIMASGEKSEP